MTEAKDPTTDSSASGDNEAGILGSELEETEQGAMKNTTNDEIMTKKEEQPPPAPQDPPAITYPDPIRGSFLTIALLLAMFLVALDMSIITTAIPTITVQFHSVDQIGWYGSAFFLCLATFQAFWGKVYKYFPIKIAFLITIGIFELGSLIAALSPNSTALIIGRAIQGLGGAGVTGGTYTILAFITRPEYLHAVFGLTSSVWSLSSVLGPVLSGIFTQYATWRWCFWVNLPIGGAAALILLLLLKMPPHSRIAHAKLKEIPFLFDIPGMAIIMGALVCLLLVLEHGGIDKAWNSGFSIGLLVAFSILMIAFVAVEWKQGEGAMVIPRIIKRRSILALALFNLTAQGGGFARIYLLPIFFQAAQGVSPLDSGLRTLPTVLATSIFSFAGSILLGKIGYYKLFLMAGAVFITVGSGMIYTLRPNATMGQYVGYQILTAVGSGLVIQVNVIVAQAISTRADVAVTVGIVLFFQFVGGTIGVSTSTNILNNVMLNSLPNGNPNISPAAVLKAGSTGLRKAFPNADDLKSVVNAYMHGLEGGFIWCIVLCFLAFVISLGAEWKSTRPEDIKKRAEAKKAAATATP
ncbi:putative MFS transporter [Leptodontidium sp. MPI-SDFR-AT-0119]|nr:putative MFS transporter [Leptodontidium sp. MPI-SDFR-AT-0119]